MFTKETIEKLQAADAAQVAQENVTQAFFGDGIASIPDGVSIKDLETYMPNRRRQRGAFATADKDSFAKYVNEHKEHGATVFINADTMRATAVLNLGTKDAPGHCDNNATLLLEKTAAYDALRDLCAGQIGQKGFSEFLEDWAEKLVCVDVDGNNIEPKKAIAAVRKLTIESMHKVESAQNSLSASRSTFEQVNATSADPIPVRLVFECAPYAGLRIHFLDVRINVLTSSKDPLFTARIVNMEGRNEQFAREFSELVTKSLGDTPVVIGSYTTK